MPSIEAISGVNQDHSDVARLAQQAMQEQNVCVLGILALQH